MHADEPLAFDHLFSAASYGPLPVPPPFEEFRAEDFKFSHEDFLGLSNSNSADALASLDSFFTPEYTESFVLTQPADEDEEPLLNQLEQRFFSEFLDNLTLDQNYSFDPQGLPPNLPVLSTLSATAHNGAITAKSIRSSAIEDLEVSESPTARKRKGGMDTRFRPSTNGGKNESAGYYGMTMAPMLANGNRLAEAVSRSPSHNVPYSEGVVLSASPPYSPSFANAVPAKRKPEQGLDSQGNARRRSNAGDPHETHSRDAVGVDSNGKASSAATATTDLPRRLSFSEVTSNSNGLSDEPVPFTPFATPVSNIRENGSVILPRSAHDEHTEIQYNHKNNSNHNENHTNTKNGKSHTLPVSPSPTVVLPPKTVPPSAISKHPPPTAASDTEQQTATSTNGPTSTSKGKKEKEKKPPKELLTEEEKRANHIASEQKRRNTIRAGFKDLTEIVPRLRDVNNSKSTILFKAVDFIHHLRQRNSTLRNIASDLEVRLKLATASGAQHRPLQPTTRHVDNSHLSHSQSHTHPHAKTSSHLLHSQLYNLHDSHRHTLNHVSTSQQSPLSPTPNSLSSA